MIYPLFKLNCQFIFLAVFPSPPCWTLAVPSIGSRCALSKHGHRWAYLTPYEPFGQTACTIKTNFYILEFKQRCLCSIDWKSSLKKRNRPNGGLKRTFITLVSSPPLRTNTPAAKRMASNTGVAVTTTSTPLTKCSLLADWKIKARTWRKEWIIFRYLLAASKP